MWSISSDNREAKAFIIIIITFLVIAVVTYGLRVYARYLSKIALDASDYMCFLALVSR